MNKKITSLALCSMLFTLSFSAEAQQPKKIPRIAYLGIGSSLNPGPKPGGDAVVRLGVTLRPIEARGPDDIEKVFTTMIRERVEGLSTLSGPVNNTNRIRITEMAAKNKLPAVYHQGLFVEGGGLMSYGPNLADMYRRAATFVDKMLKGRKPADLPVEQPTFELIINLKAAKQIGLTIPPNVLARADKVIK